MECSGDENGKLTFAFRRCVARPPTDSERAKLLALYHRSRQGFIQNAKSAEDLLRQGRIELADKPAADLAAWIVAANVLLNLDETMNKN